MYLLGETPYTMLYAGGCTVWPGGDFYSTWALSYYVSQPGVSEWSQLPGSLAACVNAINSPAANPLTGSTLDYGSSTTALGSYHPGGCNMAMADGSVQFVSQSITLSVYQTRGVKDDGQPVGGDPSNSN